MIGVMNRGITYGFIGTAISFLAMLGICVAIHPEVFHYYGYGISEFGAIHSTLIPFFCGFAATVIFLIVIALKLRQTNKILSAVFLLAALCLAGIAITSYPFNRLTYDLHWCFVSLLALVIVSGIVWRLRRGQVSLVDYVLALVFIATTIISILPIVRDIPIFRDFILRELICFVSSFWFLYRATLSAQV